MSNKIVRTICYFKEKASEEELNRIEEISAILKSAGYNIQTTRICSPSVETILEMDSSYNDQLFSAGTISLTDIKANFDRLLSSKNISFNLDLTKSDNNSEDTQILFDLIKQCPDKTSNFSYVFNNPKSTPFFPSASYSQDGFAIGLQPTDLSEDCHNLEEWFDKMKNAWREILQLLNNEKDFLGIDSSIAPLFRDKSSLINFVKKIGYTFEKSATSDIYVQMTNFIKSKNPKPVGLCGLMLPCLEDFELAEEYEQGNFSIERNLFLSLQSGLGIDTYPVGIDQDPSRVLEILQLVQKLSDKHNKALSVRLVSDGKAKIGEKTNFENQYLKDVIVREL